MYIIYCHTFPNGKKYIGLTKTTLKKRWKNGNGYKTCHLMQRAVSKYGWDNVQHDILGTAETKDVAEEMERKYVSLYKTDDAKFGYNILPGGDVATNDATEEMRHKLGNGWRGKHRSEEEKEKISRGVAKVFQRKESNGHFGLKASEEAKRKMSESHRKRYDENPKAREEARQRMIKRMQNDEFKQKVLKNLEAYRRKPGEWSPNEETREKLSKAFKGRFLGDKSPCSKPVVQVTKDGEFVKRWANAGEVERAGITSRKCVSMVCNHKKSYKTAGGFVWMFESEAKEKHVI